jgi:hypothetical protein
MRAAQVNEDGLVVNVILVEEDELEAFDAIPCPDEVGPDWTYDGSDWTPPDDYDPVIPGPLEEDT